MEGVFTIKGLENVKIYIGKFSEEEPQGITPMPNIEDLREWDMKLLKRYKPLYTPLSERCTFCTYGPCDLSKGKEGACGIDLKTQQARLLLFTTIMGASAHATHGRHILEHLIHMYGRDHQIEVGASEDKTPNISLVAGIVPKTLGDLESVLTYVEGQLSHLLASLHTGQEGSYLDFESKALHAGMLDHVGMEVADVAQVSALNMPKADENAPLVDIGLDVLDTSKPVIVCIGHNVAAAYHIMEYMEEHRYDIELGGLCCTAIDTTRVDPKRKIVGSLSSQLRFIRSGVPDVVVVDEQCVRTDTVKEASRLRIPVIATSNKIMYGLRDRTNDAVDEIVEDLVSGKEKGVLILDLEKAGEVAVKTAVAIHPQRKDYRLSDPERISELVKDCTGCGNCNFQCPEELRISEAMGAAKQGDTSLLQKLDECCIACGRCEQECPKGIPIVDVIQLSVLPIRKDKSKVRAGRGQVSDPEIREEGRNLVLGVTPGAVAMVGCPNFPGGARELYEVAEELVKRSYIVMVNGCTAMEIARFKDDEGRSLFERYPARFLKGNILNTGSCVSNSAITGAVIKVATIFAKKQLLGNYEEIADYILNRVGAVGVAWGAYSQKAQSIGLGCVRLGVPVILGPHGVKYRRVYVGHTYNKDEWWVYDARDGSKVEIEPAPEHLMITVDSKEELLPMIAKLCIRPSDNNFGRMIKLTNYIELSEKYLGRLPDDWHVFVRTEGDLPLAYKDRLLKILEDEHGWKIDWASKKIVEGPMRRLDVSFQPTNLKKEGRE
ncbi:CO dehydrogenase/acetyl-CoA synthase complex subunit epsilon [Methanosarcinales archaeon]|nr:MAG: CO dehydrogenase/acetyl-CoA synthase complex subunit epsilon [Methanosarcinales archaeon]